MPSTGDTVWFDNNATANCDGSDQSATTLAALHVMYSFSYYLGSAATALQVKATLVYIGELPNDGATYTGSRRVNLNLSTAATTVTLYRSSNSSPIDSGRECVRLKAVNASNRLIVVGGRVGVATNAVGDVATIPTIDLTGRDAVANLGAGVTWTTINQVADGSTLYANSGGTTLEQQKGTAYLEGVGAVGTAYIGGTTTWNMRAASGDDITAALEILPGGTLDLSQNPADLNLTAVPTMHASSKIKVNRANPAHLIYPGEILLSNADTISAS